MTVDTQRPEERLMRLDLWILVILGVSGIFVFFAKYDESFPSASIDLRLPKAQIVTRSKELSKKLGYETAGAIESTTFAYDDDGKTFLEYELGQARANELMRNTIPTWYWRTRYCRPLKQEEMTVALSTDGKLGYFDHKIPSGEKLPSVSHADARKMAEDFVQKEIGVSLSGNSLVDDGEEKELKRTAHTFTWKQDEPTWKDGQLYTYVRITGNKLQQFNRYLHVPDKFEHKFKTMRSWNDLFKNISYIIFVILSASIAFIFIWAFANGRVRWKLAIFSGVVTGLFAILGFFDSWPTLISQYETSSSIGSFEGRQVIRLLGSLGFSVLQAIIFVGALEPIYRLMFPKKVAIENWISFNGLRAVTVFRGLVAGMSAFGIHTAYVVAFYIFGQHVGFWSPLDARDADTLSRVSPVFDAVNVGLFASTMEEMMYRVLCLAIFQRLTKNFWLANFLQAASWAFMHSDYPQEPAYVRGVELSIGGIFYGWVLRRFGLLATVLSHYTYDAFLGVTSLVMSPSIGDRVLSLVAIAPGLLALAASAILIRFKGKFVDETPLENDEVPLSPRPPAMHEIETDHDIPYVSLSKFVRCTLVAVATFAIIGTFSLKPHWLGENNDVTITRQDALRIGRDHLAKLNISTDGMQSIAWLAETSDETELQYVLEKEGFKRAHDLEIGIEPRINWRVRFFKELDNTEYYVLLDGAGHIYSQYVVKDEEAAGAKLTTTEATRRVESFIRKYHPDLLPLELDKDPTVHDYKHRRDDDVNFTSPRFKAGEADFKVQSGTVGGDVSGLTTGWLIPDEWKFDRQKKKDAEKNIGLAARSLGAVLLGLVGLWVMFDVLRAHAIRWRPAIILGTIAAIATLIHCVNAAPNAFFEYSTERAFTTFVVEKVVEAVIQVIATGAAIGLAAAFVYGAFRLAFQQKISAFIRPILPVGLGGTGSNKQLWLDATISATALISVAFLVDKGVDYAASMTSPAVHLYSLSNVAEFTDEASIWVKALVTAVLAGALAPVSVAMSSSVCARLLGGKFWKVLLASLASVAMLGAGQYYWQEYAWQIASVGIMTSVAYIFVAKIVRFNLLTYILAGYGLGLLPILLALLRSAPKVYYADVAVIFAALAAPVVYTAWLWLFASKGNKHLIEVDESR